MALHCKLLRCFRVNLWGGIEKGFCSLWPFMTFLYQSRCLINTTTQQKLNRNPYKQSQSL
ncbi:hypothetical protein DD780_00170 [Helicobacter pylori]|uniref:hypothetical protein n=1 Tax=Helicobacter pylori TaxID=210 RepID=UPI000EB0D520|nr:hypothetical protein [Helicobacter pylori]RKV47595.1 hypothetical protein DD780_00170 [Helicobacter pylori]